MFRQIGVGDAETFEKVAFTMFHMFGFGLRFVIKPLQVQHAVNYEVGEMILRWFFLFASLMQDDGQAEHQVTGQIGRWCIGKG